MGDAVLQKFLGHLAEPGLFIQAPGVGLGLNADGTLSQPSLRRLKPLLQQLGAKPLAALAADDPAQGGLSGKDTPGLSTRR